MNLTQQGRTASLEEKIDTATEFIKAQKRVIVALSGGVDSSLVTLLAYRALGDNVLAVTAESPSLPPGEREEAERVAREIGINHVTIKTSEVSDPDYYTNPRNRCYYCKRTLYCDLSQMALREGFHAILDGTIADDLNGHRPGLAAAREFGVLSPLAEAGFMKEDVRGAARRLNLSVHDKPSMACLSSRIPYGQLITLERLSRVGEAEKFIKEQTGIRQVRVRDLDGAARIEVPKEEMTMLLDEDLIEKITGRLVQLGFKNVTLDMRGYRTGSLDEGLHGTLRDLQTQV